MHEFPKPSAASASSLPPEPTEQPPTLPDTSTWVRREPGDVIEAGTPCMFHKDGDQGKGLVVHFGGLDSEMTVLTGLPLWTPPPAPSEPWSSIPEGIENAADLRVNGIPGRYFLHLRGVCMVGPYDDTLGWVLDRKDVTHVELLHTHNPETHVPVERALIDEAARLLHAGRITGSEWRATLDLIRDLASLASDESSDTDGGRS